MGSVFGLTLSVGKVYVDNVYANINSTAIHCDCNSTTSACIVQYLNTGLFFGQNKVMSRRDIDLSEEQSMSNFAPHIAVIDKVVSGSLPGKQRQILSAYMSLHRDALTIEARGRNLFIHQSLGGWGIGLPVEWDFYVTDTQKLEANRLALDAGISLQRPWRLKVPLEVEDKFVEPWSPIVVCAEPRLRPSKAKHSVELTSVAKQNLLIGVLPKWNGLDSRLRRHVVSTDLD